MVRPGELPASLAPLSVVQPDLLVPMQGIDERLEGMLVLGPRLSDKPYGREDRELVASVANQAGTVLENLRLASAVAERLEAERLAGRELEIAREVQLKLLPQQAPATNGWTRRGGTRPGKWPASTATFSSISAPGGSGSSSPTFPARASPLRS